MENERINLALQKAKDTKSVLIGSGVFSAVDELFERSFGSQTAIVIADENTFTIAGKKITSYFESAGRQQAQPIIFPGSPVLYADMKNVQHLEAILRTNDAIPVVVGSGTLNDITKLAAYHCARPYMVIATAASMDGYTAYGAAITQDGFKQTFSCPAPKVVLADMDVIAKAPLKMTASGYADLLGKFTAGADWIISDCLNIEPINQHAWSLVQDSLREWTGSPELVRDGDSQSIAGLFEGLVLTGLAMQSYQSSRPASGSEHQFSHFWEMHESVHGSVSHGYKVGVGSIASAALYERVLARDLSNLDIPGLCRNWLTRDQVQQFVRKSHLNPVLAGKAVEQSLAKYIDADQLRERLELLKICWSELRLKLQNQMLTASNMSRLLMAMGCPTQPSQIGKNSLELKSSYALARQIRSRYTIFDLANETGCFNACVDELFASGGFWSSETGLV